MTMRQAARFAALALTTGACVINGGSSAPPAAAPGAVPPPSAFNHAGFLYYGQPGGNVRVPVMPPARSRPVALNRAHLQAALAQPRRCNIPLEVAPGVFVHMDCVPYKRIAIATKHATALKINLMRTRGVVLLRHGELERSSGETFASGEAVGSPLGSIVAVTTAALPDVVDHRMNGTEGPIKDQGDVGACTAFALSAVMDNALRRSNLNITTSPEHVWGHYGVPTMEDAAQDNVNRGITTFDALPYSGKEACEITKDQTDDCGETYGVAPNTSGGDAALQQKLRTADGANGHRLIGFEELQIQPPNLDEMTALLASGADIWAGFDIDSSVWVNRRMNANVIPDWTTPDGGHSVAIAGYRKVGGSLQFLIHNSWGASWGDGGYAWISQAMVQKWMHLAYKVRTDADPGSPASPVPAQTDEDCRGDQVLDSVTNKCAGVCPDQTRPANGMCPSGPAPAPQVLSLPTLPGFAGLPGVQLPTIPGFTIPGFSPPAGQPSAPQQNAAPGQSVPGAIPTAWPWPVPSSLPNIFAPPPAAPAK